jgi:SAM-dependent methyltransferase
MTEAINTDQITAWNDSVGRTWVKMNPGLDRQLEPIGAELLARAQLAEGQAVLDIGCGAGATSIAAAELVGSTGRVLGVDISTPLLELARERSAPITNLRFVQADAQTHGFEDKAFDRVVSRFGVMFFEDPTAAFANIRRGCRPNARLTFVCWRQGSDNPWLVLPLQAAQHLVPPRPAGDPEAPGPTAFARPQRVRDILAGSGWRDVRVEPFDIPVGGGDLEETTALMTRVGPLGHAIRDAGAGRELIDAASDAVREAMGQFRQPDGLYWMPAATWMVTARA